MRPKLAGFAFVVQTLFILGHAFFFVTWMQFWRPRPPWGARLAWTVGLLALSFLAASLLAQRFPQRWARVLYTLAAAWLGIATYLFLAACACWAVRGGLAIIGVAVPGRELAGAFYGLAVLVGLYGMANAAVTRVRRITVALKGLPAVWHGACIALVSDLHLGHVRHLGFARRVVGLINRQQPQAVLIAGDLFDGTPCDLDLLAEPWSRLAAPRGVFYISGNHESFAQRAPFVAAVERAGLRVLHNEMVVIEGLQLVGIHYSEAAEPRQLREILRRAGLDRATPAIVLTHAPDHLDIAEAAGVALLLAGHTHGGQFFPVTHIVRRIYGRFTKGLQRLGGMQVFTSYGAGTWGPPLRVGTTPEVVLLRFVAETP